MKNHGKTREGKKIKRKVADYHRRKEEERKRKEYEEKKRTGS
jgi:hypothetical protein